MRDLSEETKEARRLPHPVSLMQAEHNGPDLPAKTRAARTVRVPTACVDTPLPDPPERIYAVFEPGSDSLLYVGTDDEVALWVALSGDDVIAEVWSGGQMIDRLGERGNGTRPCRCYRTTEVMNDTDTRTERRSG